MLGAECDKRAKSVGRPPILANQRGNSKRSTDFVILLEALDRRYAPGPGAVTKPTVIVLDNVPIHMPIGDVRIDVRCANGNPRSIPRSLVTNQMGILAVRCPIMVEE